MNNSATVFAKTVRADWAAAAATEVSPAVHSRVCGSARPCVAAATPDVSDGFSRRCRDGAFLHRSHPAMNRRANFSRRSATKSRTAPQ